MAALAAIAGVILLIFTNCISVVGHLTKIYFEFAVRCGIVLVVTLFLCRRFPKIILPLFYVFLFILFFLGISLGTYITPQRNATTFFVFLVALPLLIMDKPWRIDAFLFAVTTVFCICAEVFKPADIASLDIFNAVSFLFVGFVANHYVTKMKLSDIAGRIHTEKERDTDSLTGLTNRRAAEKIINDKLTLCDKTCATILLDMDYFKEVNDTLGHQFGDRLLVEQADRIRGIFRSTDVVCRLGGDEFLVFADSIPHIKWLKERVMMLNRISAVTLNDGDNTCKVSVSIGISIYPKDGQNFYDLYRNADTALYKSKELGRNRYTIYENKESQNK